MKVVAFIEDDQFIDKITYHLKLTYTAERPLHKRSTEQQLYVAAEEREGYF